MAIALDGSVRLVVMQFSFSSAEAVPASVRARQSETLAEREMRKSRAGGLMVIQPTEKTSLVDLFGELEERGFELVDALYKERIDGKDPALTQAAYLERKDLRTYHMVRFVFAHSEYATPSAEFRGVRNAILADLRNMCATALWRVRAFNNPFYQNGEETPDLRVLSINLEARMPLFRPDGQPVTVWQKDREGRRVGEAPLALRAAYALHLVGSYVRLV